MLRLSLVLAAVTLVGGSPREGQPGRIVLRQGWPEAPPNSPSSAVSGDGRYVAFVSAARLLPLDTNTLDDIYILERESGRLTLATPPVLGCRVRWHRVAPSAERQRPVSRFQLARDRPDRRTRPERSGRRLRARWRDRLISRVSVGPGRQEANGRSAHASISDDGRWVVFESTATNLVPHGDANGTGYDVYLADSATQR